MAVVFFLECVSLFQFFIGHLFQLDSVRSFPNIVFFLSPSAFSNPLTICTAFFLTLERGGMEGTHISDRQKVKEKAK